MRPTLNGFDDALLPEAVRDRVLSCVCCNKQPRFIHVGSMMALFCHYCGRGSADYDLDRVIERWNRKAHNHADAAKSRVNLERQKEKLEK